MFAYCPDVGLPRLIRFIPKTPDVPPDFVAGWSEKTNLVVIIKETFDTLTPRQQERVRRTFSRALILADIVNQPE